MKSRAVLTGSYYVPARGGHAPGDIRDAFAEALDAYEDWADGEPEPTVELRDKQVPISAVFGLLWNCSDILPDAMWRQAADLGADESAKSHTYSAIARWLKPQTEASRPTKLAAD